MILYEMSAVIGRLWLWLLIMLHSQAKFRDIMYRVVEPNSVFCLITKASKNILFSLSGNRFYRLFHFFILQSLSPGKVRTEMTDGLLTEEELLTTLETSDITDAAIYALSSPPDVNVRKYLFKC